MRKESKRGQLPVEARCVQRASYLVADQGELDEALGLVQRASILFLTSYDVVAVAKTWVDAAILLGPPNLENRYF